MAQVYTVAGSTSVVLISTIQVPNTVVLLSSIQNPGRIVGIRDITGSSQLAQYPIIVSTMSGLTFYDGTSSIVLNTPNGSVSIASKDSTTWQLLNSVGFLTNLANGFVDRLASDYAFVSLTSTTQEYVSSLQTRRLDVQNIIEVLGDTNIEGNLTIGGSFNVFSTAHAYQNLLFSSSLEVGGTVSFPSSLFVRDALQVGSYLSTSQNLVIGGDLNVDKSVYVFGALLPRFLSVQTFEAQLLETGGGIQVAGGISTTSMSVGGDAIFLGKGVLKAGTTVQSQTAVYGSLEVGGALQTSTLLVEGPVAVFKEAYVGTLNAIGSVSTMSSFFLSLRLTASGETRVEGEVNADTASVRDLLVQGASLISSLSVFSTLRSQGEASAYGSTFLSMTNLDIQNHLGIEKGILSPGAFASISTGFSTLTDLSVFGGVSAKGGLFVREESYLGQEVRNVSTLFVKGDVSTFHLQAQGELFVDGNLFVNGRAAASTLGAPISLNISTLTLSNTLTVDSYGKIPVLKLFDYPEKMIVGNPQSLGAYDVVVGGILQNRSTVAQTVSYDYNKLWTANDLFVSTFGGSSNLSTLAVGQTNFAYPLEELNNGIVLTGTNSVGSNLFYGSSIGSGFRGAGGNFSTRGNKVRYNGSNLWVAVGIGAIALQSIQYSPDGFNWFSAGSGGFSAGGNDLAFGNGRWVATGNNGGGPSIQYSDDGIVWQNGTNTFTLAGTGIVYNGSNLWVAVGSNGGGSPIFGVKFSGDGINWSNASPFGGSNIPISFTSVGFGAGRYLASALTFNQVYTSVTGSNNWQVSPGNVVRNTYLYRNPFWIGGGTALGQPNLTIQLSPNGVNWIPITSGGFTGACYDIISDNNTSTILAVGEDSSPSPIVLKFSQDLSNWQTKILNGYIGSGRGIAIGNLRVPTFEPLFTGNLTTLFRSTLSSGSIFASTVKASSIFGQFSANGSGLTNIGTFASSIRTSSIYATTIKAIDISAEQFFGFSSFTADKITVPRVNFFSTTNIFLGAGNDSQSNGNLQYSFNVVDWSRSFDSNFEFYGNDVTGTDNANSPFFVAVGADSRTAYTIQWSLDGYNWNPAISGGFSYATVTGIREGKSIAYNSNLNRWVAVGVDTGGNNTILYSGDGSNWSNTVNGFPNVATKVKASPNGYVAIGNGTRFSLDGITWNVSDSASQTLTAIGYGTFSLPPTLSITGWLGINSLGSLLGSQTEGASWQNTGVLVMLSATDLANGGSRWMAVGSNLIQTSSNGFNWSNVTTSFGSEISFTSLAYNSNVNTWVAGSRATNNRQSIHYSLNALTWTQISTGGFSTAIDSYGVGYGIASLGFSTFAGGRSALDINTAVRTAIFQISTNFSSINTGITSISLTTSNTSNVFSTVVRGIAATPDEFYKLVAVGDGVTPQRTIARSVDGSPNSWIPAITGGFSTTGYAVTYAQDRWLAVGDAQVSTNFIQYSPDGANWFGTNNSAGIRQGGRGIAVGISTLYSTFVAVGKDTTLSSIVYSKDGFNWSNSFGSTFNVQGNAVAGGLNWPALPFLPGPYVANYVAVGQDTRGETYSISRSEDGINWSNIDNGGFDTAGYGVAYSIDNKRWVAVGADTRGYTIQYSQTGGYSFIPAGNAFTGIGYGVTYNSSMGAFFAVGQDLNGDSEGSIKYSGDGVTWFNISTGSGFISQKSLGATNGLFTQGIFTTEVNPYINFSNFIVYERQNPIFYSRPTLRLQSTFVSYNETMFLNLSSQVSLGSNAPQVSTALTVYGDIYASSFLYTGVFNLTSTLYVSSVIVSTLSTVNTCFTEKLLTPSLGINAPFDSRANSISTLVQATDTTLQINKALYVQKQGTAVGIRNPDPVYSLDVRGTFGASTLSTSVLYASENINMSTAGDNVFFNDQYLKLFKGTNDSFVDSGNRIQVTPSSMTFNSLVTLQISTQRIGVFTRNPEFDFDVRRHGYLSNLKSSTIQTSLIFLTLQSV